MFKKWNEVIEVDFPKIKTSTENIKNSIQRQKKWIRSVRLLMGRVVTHEEWVSRRKKANKAI